MRNRKTMTVRLARKTLFAVLLGALAGGCVSRNHYATVAVLPYAGDHAAAFSRAEQTIKDLFPPQYRATQRAIVTADGKEFACDGLLNVSPTEGHHLAIVSSFGVVTDLRVRADGESELLKVTPLFREDWSRRFVARDLRCLFVAPANLRRAGRLADDRLVLKTAPDSAGVTAEYIFSPDGVRWQALDLMRNGTTFYRVEPKRFRKYLGASVEMPAEYEVSAEAYRLELRIAELVLPKAEAQP
jgi:hypothetical protein